MNKPIKEPSLKLGRPSYQQIQTWLLEKLGEETWEVGSRIPGETTLAKQFGISAMPVRQALQNLTAEGYFVRQRGKGTFIKKLSSKVQTETPVRKIPPANDLLRGKTIAICVPSVKKFEDPSARLLFLISSIESLLKKIGCTIRFIEFTDTNSVSGQACDSFLSDKKLIEGVDGIILFISQHGDLHSNDQAIYEVVASGLPAVAYDYYGHAPINRVEVDEFSANKMLLEHLTDLGCENIIFCAQKVAPNHTPAWLETRVRGFKEAASMLQLGLTDEDILIAGPPPSGINAGLAEADEVFKILQAREKRVDAIIAAHDPLALGICKAFSEHETRCPPIVGFDNLYRARTSGLTTIATPADKMSISALQLLRDQFQKETPYIYRRVFHLSELIIRESSRNKNH